MKSYEDLIFENNIADIRILNDKTTSEIANWLGISRMQYYRYEHNLSPIPARIIAALAYYYSCPEYCLFKTKILNTEYK